MISLFAITTILITAYATDAATNTTTDNSSVDTDNQSMDVSNKYVTEDKQAESAWLHSELNVSDVQVRINGNFGNGIEYGYGNTSIEVNEGSGWQTWDYKDYDLKQNTNNTLGILTGPKPVNITKIIDYQAIVDAIGQEEAKFDDVQKITLDGIDDATVIEYYGYGDCWTDSCWLYNKLSAAGVQVRIMGYEDGGRDDGYRHTWIEFNIGHGWETWNYTKYGSK
ncbi:MAG: transglutaminase domain-containing protein, partial [Methanobacterium sp.]|nr:transglutaminase domain-containing protein [Methanobacterium sp.]